MQLSRTERSTSSGIAKSVVWLWGSQAATVLVQFGYAAFTSRIVSPSGFGAYSVSLAVAALIVLIANGGLSQTIARLVEPDVAVVRSLVTLAILLGAVGSVFLWFTAPLWATLWGVPAATAPIRFLAINAFTAPLLGVATGYTRRVGRFRELALTTFAANCTGMALGALTVALFRTSTSLLVSAVVAQTAILATCVVLSSGLLIRPGNLRAGTREFGFSAKIVLTTVLAYAAGNVGKLGISSGLGAGALGQLNRAEVVGWVPFQYAQDAMTQVIYPEFRHDRHGTERATRVWTDLLTLTAWIALPGSALAAAVLPLVVPLLLGPRWSQAAALTTPLAIIGGMQIVVYLLYNALEAVGRFASIWTSQLIQVALNATGAVLAVTTRSFAPVMIALIVGALVQHALQLWHARAAGYLVPSVLLRRYVLIVLVGAAIFGVARGFEAVVRDSLLGAASLPIVFVATAVIAAVLLRCFRRLPPVALAQQYGLLSRSSSRD